MTGMGERLRAVADARGPLCVGIDPHASLLTAWGLPDSAAGAREMSLAVISACTGHVGIVKPQVAFFERFGAAGITVLQEVIGAARSADLFVIADAKRGDIGSTAEGYAAAWVAADAPLRSDALTVSPYLGVGALSPLIDIARSADNGVFVLAATSNPDGTLIQGARTSERSTVAAAIVSEVAEQNARAQRAGEWGDVGVVIGATRPLAESGLDARSLAGVPVLAPGFGAQGAALENLREIFGAAAAHVIPTVSRSVLHAGRDGVTAAIQAHLRELSR
jgi:orotidine-5'-phosphate decarboxylase